MKTLKIFSFFFSLMFGGLSVSAQNNVERLNLPGDNLNLFAVIKLFQESETLEGFEKNLNAEDSKINNLDLNGDDKTDYIKVFDNVDGDDHTIVLQVAVSERENQDIAVITVQKDKNGAVQVQLIGDEDLYGKDYIIEPNYEDSGSTPNPGYVGNVQAAEGEKVVVTKTTYVEVQTWPVVRYIYAPVYVVWRSPWYWGYYPPYWNPWRPFYWDYYYGYHSNYYPHYYGRYRHSHHYRAPYYRNNYYDRRSVSSTVRNNRDNGRYRDTYSRPETRNQGSADFKKRYPNGINPSTRPGTNNARPATGIDNQRPSTKPANVNKPSSRPGNVKPSTRPATVTPGTRPETKPAARPATKPTSRPATTQPSARPATVKPSSKPANRPANQISKPTTRPAPASGKSSNTRQSSTKPAPAKKSDAGRSR